MPPKPVKPIGVPVSTATYLVGQSEHTLRRRIAEGSVQLLPGSGYKRVSIAGLEQVAGRPFTIEEIASAEACAARAYAAYVAKRQARAKKSIERKTA